MATETAGQELIPRGQRSAEATRRVRRRHVRPARLQVPGHHREASSESRRRGRRPESRTHLAPKPGPCPAPGPLGRAGTRTPRGRGGPGLERVRLARFRPLADSPSCAPGLEPRPLLASGPAPFLSPASLLGPAPARRGPAPAVGLRALLRATAGTARADFRRHRPGSVWTSGLDPGFSAAQRRGETLGGPRGAGSPAALPRLRALGRRRARRPHGSSRPRPALPATQGSCTPTPGRGTDCGEA